MMNAHCLSSQIVTITSPVPDEANKVKSFTPAETLTFQANVVDNDANLEYRWEIQFVHNNHILIFIPLYFP